MSGHRSTLAQIVADSLQNNLRDGDYHCGDRLAESIIAREMNVSQNTARDALNILQRAGWVVRHPRRGVMVRQFSTEETIELYILRITLEKLALTWMMETITEAEKAQLARIIAEARLELNTDSDRGARDAIFEFHARLLAITQKPQTTHLLTIILNQCRLLNNLKARHDPYDYAAYARIITDYGDLMTHIRYDHVQAACSSLEKILVAERRALLPMLDLVK